MAEFPTVVNAPSPASYAPPLVDFSDFANWGNDYFRGVFNQQQAGLNQQQGQLNDQRIAQMRQQTELSQAFPGGIPTDPRTGQIDYAKMASILAAKGDIGGAVSLLQSQPAPLSPLLGGGAAPAPGSPAPIVAPASIPARPLPPPAAGSPKGDAGSGTITSMVTDRLGGEDLATGQTIAKIAGVMGIDPNANLTPGQQLRVQGLLRKYAQGGPPATPPPAPIKSASADEGAPGATPRERIAERFPSLPPSVSAVSPAPPSPAAAGAGGGAAAAPAPIPGGAVPLRRGPAEAAPAEAPHPVGSQVPLPHGFSDPQAAILALRAEAARLSQFPRSQGQMAELNNWAERIEQSLKPLSVRPGETLIDQRTGQPVYQGNQPTLSPQAVQDAAERYLQTGQFPPNMGRGMQGTADRNAILEEANRLATDRGIDTATLPQKWQQFKSQQIALQRFTSGPQGNTVRSFNVLVDHLDTLSDAATALRNGDIRLFNRFKQNWNAATGDTAPTNFDGVKALVGDEIVKAVVGGAGALADREEVKKDLDRASSPKQLAELVEKYKKLALGQLRGLRKQYEVSTGQKNFGEMLLPGTLAALGGNKGEGGAPDAEGWVTLPNGARIQEIK